MNSSPLCRAARIEALLDSALDLDEAAQIDFLNTVEPELRGELAELLKADAAQGVLDRTSAGLVAAAADVVRLEGVIDSMVGAGQRIGHYRLLHLLGEGGMASVWLAERDDGTFSHRVAVKCLKTGLATSESRARFLREQQILAQLQHPNIARLYDAGISEDSVPFIVMEWVDGKTVTRDCDERRLSLKQRLQQFMKICSAVGYAHQSLIVHRDIKPGNILVSSDGEPKLLDFGIAKLLDEASEPMTQTGLQLLTPDYAAPEQFNGCAVTTATDVYALGGVLYEMLCGSRPRQRPRGRALDVTTPITTPSEALRRITNSDASESKQLAAMRASTPERLRRALYGDLDTVVMKALQPEPSRRYPTVQALSEDIGRYLDQQPIQARKEAWVYHMRKFLERHVLGITLATAIIAALLTATAISVHQARRAEAEANRATTEAGRAQAETQRAQGEAKRALAIEGFLINLFEVADSGLPRDQVPTTQALLEDGVKRIQGEFNDAPELKLELLLLLGQVQRNLGLYDSAERLLKEAVTIADANLQHGDAVWLQAQTEWAGLLLRRSQSESVVQQLSKAVEQYRASTSRESVQLANALSVLGEAYRLLSRFQEAVAVTEEALNLAKRVLRAHDQQVQEFSQQLGKVLISAERWKEAEVLLRENVALSKAFFGERNAKYASSLAALGGVMTQQGKNAEAETLHRQAVAINEVIYDRPNAQFVASVLSLGVDLYRQNKLQESEAVLRRALQMQSKLTGSKDDAVTADILQRLATTVWKISRPVEAEHFYRQALEIETNSSSSDSMVAGQIWAGLALTLRDQKRYEAAIAASNRAIEINRRIYGDKGRLVGLDLADLATIEQKQGRLKLALQHIDQGMQILEAFVDRKHPHLVIMNVMKGEILNALHEYRVAKNLLAPSIALMRQSKGSGNRDMIWALEELARSEQGLGDFNEVLELCNEALALARSESSPDKEIIASLEKLMASASKNHAIAVSSEPRNAPSNR